MKKTNIVSKSLSMLLAMVMAFGCLGITASAADVEPETALPYVIIASGERTVENRNAIVDYSDADDGYVMVQFTKDADYRLKCQVTGPDDVTYTYNLTAKEWDVFPLSAGSGDYKVVVFEETGEGTGMYYTRLRATFNAKVKDEFTAFLLPNQYVDYGAQENTLAKADELVGDKTGQDAIDAVYDFVVDSLKYDKYKAMFVRSGYLPYLDDILESRMGICFDYAALMAGMLRYKGVPCKLVVGYAGKAYHAWVSVWNGEAWVRMDPTFASSGNRSDAIMRYIADDSNYTARYTY